MARIIEAGGDDISAARDLFVEYAETLNFNLCFQDFDSELAGLPGDYAAPKGCILLAYEGSLLAGCVASRPLESGTSELKRLYVRPQFRGKNIGRSLVMAVIKKAIQCGYRRIRLDTVPEMSAAIALYEELGFQRIGPYRENPIPGALYFEKVLTV